ncbi:hypothetical protein HZC34_03070 [Candidatus Saganbacteria bacterium]|nr:hypothetical protein [Candidatus Saganbacteria bacterium]
MSNIQTKPIDIGFKPTDITRQVRESANSTPFAGTPKIPDNALGAIVTQMLEPSRGLGGIRFTISPEAENA